MDMQKFDQILAHLNLEQLREANRLVCGRINREHVIREQKVARNFNIGDKIKFVSNRGGWVTGVVDRINTKSLSGRVVRPDGSVGFGNWRASPSLCHRA